MSEQPVGFGNVADIDRPLWSMLDWSFWGHGVGDELREHVAAIMVNAVPREIRDQLLALFVAWKNHRGGLPSQPYEELRRENKRLRDELGSARDWEAWERKEAEIKKHEQRKAMVLAELAAVSGPSWSEDAIEVAGIIRDTLDMPGCPACPPGCNSCLVDPECECYDHWDADGSIKPVAADPLRCPTCESPAANLHPAVQHEGEVQVCNDPWHRAGHTQKPSALHIGRSWVGHEIEDGCPCPQAPCGLVDTDTIVADCTEHALLAAKSSRQGHWANECASVAEGLSSTDTTAVEA